MNSHCTRKILVFVKAPVKGQVKTRLSNELGDPFVLDLYKQFVKDVVAKAVGVETTTLCFYPYELKAKITDFLGPGFSMLVQTGADLGEKMANAFHEEFNRGTGSVILIGTDIPDISPDILIEAFDGLLTHDAVIGPSTDGGYYLIGFNDFSFNPEIFRHISWSTTTVFDDTIRRLEKQNLRYHILPFWNDIDTPEDFYKLSLSLQTGKTCAPHTRDWLLKNGKKNINHHTGS